MYFSQGWSNFSTDACKLNVECVMLLEQPVKTSKPIGHWFSLFTCAKLYTKRPNVSFLPLHGRCCIFYSMQKEHGFRSEPITICSIAFWPYRTLPKDLRGVDYAYPFRLWWRPNSLSKASGCWQTVKITHWQKEDNCLRWRTPFSRLRNRMNERGFQLRAHMHRMHH